MGVCTVPGLQPQRVRRAHAVGMFGACASKPPADVPSVFGGQGCELTSVWV